MEALENAMNSSNEFVLDNMVNALLTSKNPRILAVLLRHRRNNNSFIPIAIINALAKIDTEESRALLNELLNDKNQEVRNKAQIILDKREKKIIIPGLLYKV